jgi:hypothetical protein
MPGFDPSQKHPLYKKWINKWRRQRDVLDGEDRLKEDDVAEEYLPRLDGQGNSYEAYWNKNAVVQTYEGYKSRASFMNATGRTKEGLVGAIMRKEPDVQWLDADSLDTIGYGLESWSEIIHETLDEVIGVGRHGHLVDMPEEAEDGAFPYVASYIAESITNWRLGILKGRKRPTMIVLKEASGFYSESKSRELEKYRVLRLGSPQSESATDIKRVTETGFGPFFDEAGVSEEDVDGGAFYFQEIWVEVDEATKGTNVQGKKFERVSITIPRQAGGLAWREIPFVFYNPGNTKAKPEKPTLMDLTVVNLSHYRNSADIEHGLHFTALPQPWASGFGFDKEKTLYIGSGVAWTTDEPNAKAGMLEFKGTGLAAIKTQMDGKEKQMAALGARLIEEQPKPGAAESFETHKLRHSGDGSVLARISISTSKGLTKVQQFIAAFRGSTAPVKTVLNLDFGTEDLTSDVLDALMRQVQGGLMSWDTYVHNVRKGELYKDNWTKEEEARAILEGTPGQSIDALLQPKPIAQAPPTDDDDGDGDE